ncbi:MAG: chloride channel protein [Moorella humiferrea]|nr:chloride channel protein [Moorella humiferrea]
MKASTAAFNHRGNFSRSAAARDPLRVRLNKTPNIPVKIPNITNSGSRRELVWWRVIPIKFIAGALAIGAGLSLGREGPTVQMGVAAGQLISKYCSRSKTEALNLIACGAGAGLAAAFNAPLAGVIFVLEELRRNFSPYVLGGAFAASITADLISQKILGPLPAFRLKELLPVPLNTPISTASTWGIPLPAASGAKPVNQPAKAPATAPSPGKTSHPQTGTLRAQVKRPLRHISPSVSTRRKATPTIPATMPDKIPLRRKRK